MLVIESREIKNIENLAAGQGIPVSSLMERAGKNVADFASKFIKDKSAKVCIVSGTGNNGGDGFVAAGILADKCKVAVILADGFPRSLLASNYFNILPHSVIMNDFTEKHVKSS